MNEEDQHTHATDRQDEAEEDRQVWNKRALVAATNRPQHDQAIRKNARKDSEHDLRGAAAHEVPQDARGILARSHCQCHQGH